MGFSLHCIVDDIEFSLWCPEVFQHKWHLEIHSTLILKIEIEMEIKSWQLMPSVFIEVELRDIVISLLIDAFQCNHPSKRIWAQCTYLNDGILNIFNLFEAVVCVFGFGFSYQSIWWNIRDKLWHANRCWEIRRWDSRCFWPVAEIFLIK